MRVLELFAGIGGCAAALSVPPSLRVAELSRQFESTASPGRPEPAEVVAAIDIDEQALAVYRRNFPHPTLTRTIESLPADELAAFEADLWWMSPPCQPYTRRGLQRDTEDPRSQALANVTRCLASCRPKFLALENVPEFADSEGCQRLKETLSAGGYTFREWQLCPSSFGWPMRRRRYYLFASRVALRSSELPEVELSGRTLQSFLLPAADVPAACDVPAELLQQYSSAFHVVHADDPAAVTGCFTSAYGRSPVRSGSYLRQETADGSTLIRRFAPLEILRLLGFPEQYSLPDDLTTQRAWSLVGNSLAVPVVRSILTLAFQSEPTIAAALSSGDHPGT